MGDGRLPGRRDRGDRRARPALVEATGIAPGDHVLDIAAGSGNASIPAAQAGADVVASDLTPDLIETGRQAAAAAASQLRWEVADAEALPYADAEFDAAISCVGVMFAPHHQPAPTSSSAWCAPAAGSG